MSLKTKVVYGADKLSQEARAILGKGKLSNDWHSYLLVYHNDKLITVESSEMEPEDVSFGRDLKWVPTLLHRVYALGHDDAKGIYSSDSEAITLY